MQLEEEIVQSKFKDVWHKAFINILYTSNWLSWRNAELFKEFGLSSPQFNILRILRGQHPKPATIRLLTERMLDKMSNASRLVEKLRQKGLVERDICPSDRRQVHVRVTAKGLDLLRRMDERMDAEENVMAAISEEEANELNRILDKLRG
jgi:DNA-binding MarR family transcriptional regulator